MLSVIITNIYRKQAIKKKILDTPNERSSHHEPIPRGGGIVFAFLWIASCSLTGVIGLVSIDDFILFLPSAIIVGFVGFLDDTKGLSAPTRAFFHIFAAFVLFINICVEIEYLLKDTSYFHFFWYYFFGILGVAWSINLFNFMDGTDGIATCEGILVLGVGGGVLYYFGAFDLAFIAWILVSVLMGFLWWNKPKANIFMGDVGSGLIGFMIGAIAVVSKVKHDVPITIWIILYMSFWFDASVTLLRRFFNNEKWYKAHKQHAYQKLHHILNKSHKEVLIYYMVQNVVLAGLAIGALLLHSYFLGLFLALFVVAIFYLSVEVRVRRISGSQAVVRSM